MTDQKRGWKAAHRAVNAEPTSDEIDGLGWDIEGVEQPMLRGMFAKAEDAYLAAAAPDMLAALEGVAARCCGEYPGHPETLVVLAAIAKATGK